mgnify:CR=1 FL=1
MLRGRFEAADPTPVTRVQRAGAALYVDKDTAGLPAYGFVNPKYGAYAEYLHRGPQSPWIPRWVLQRLAEEPGRRAEIVALGPKTIVSCTVATRLNGAVVGVLW